MDVLTQAIAAWGTAKLIAIFGGVGLSYVIGFLLRKIPEKKLKNWVYARGELIGVGITVGLSRWKYTAPVWNKVIEPWLINILRNLVMQFITGLIDGMKSDNKKDE